MALAISGCTNPTATNYNPLATIDDGSCIGGLTPGCCDPTATNFDPLATCDDGSCEYTGGGGGDWNCNECTTLTMCDGWNGIMGHLPLMSYSNTPIPRTDIGQTFTTVEEARIWYFDNPTISASTTYFTFLNPNPSTTMVTQSYNASTYFINGVDWTGGVRGTLFWVSMNLHYATNGQFGYPMTYDANGIPTAASGPMTPHFGGMGGAANNIINWYMNEGFQVYQGMTWLDFKAEIGSYGPLGGPGSLHGGLWNLEIATQALCSDNPPMGCIQAPAVFTCEEVVGGGGSFATKQECIDDGCETV